MCVYAFLNNQHRELPPQKMIMLLQILEISKETHVKTAKCKRAKLKS
jgi:hypothetical protein